MEVNLLTIGEILADESKNVEFKVQRPKDSIKYMKTVIAFSNGEGGRIVFGVDDDTREVVGIPKENVFSEIDAITTAISDSCEPVVIPDVYLQTIEDKTIIIAEISPENRDRIISSPWELRMALISGFRGHPVLLDVT